MRIGLYDPYLSTLGGGENVLAVLAEVLERRFPDATLDLIVHRDEGVTPADLGERFGVALRQSRLRVVPSPRSWLDPALRLDLARRLVHEAQLSRLSGEYDLFVNNTIFSTLPCRAPRSLFVCMFPLDPGGRDLAAGSPRRALRKLNAYLRRAYFARSARTYSAVIANSEFTRSWISRLWGVEARVLYPPVEIQPRFDPAAKTHRILSVGRFFPGEHNKKHLPMIETFVRLQDAGHLAGWEFHLVGSITPVPGARAYAEELVARAAGYPVHFHFDASAGELAGLLRASSLFWHATGLGEDSAAQPEKLEHFGISTIEAMSHGCVPIVIAMGGQPEIVRHGVDGLLWEDLAGLAEQTLMLAADADRRGALARAAFERSLAFGRDAFEATALDILATLGYDAPRPSVPVVVS
ncbi:MAG: glycosyltransferase family 4 protein [Candidatus Sericytochromatia bacterium]|nr:glycosyltransferase family 4 protein [Candidatus Tanganyikabacteria bacterium]